MCTKQYAAARRAAMEASRCQATEPATEPTEDGAEPGPAHNGSGFAVPSGVQVLHRTR